MSRHLLVAVTLLVACAAPAREPTRAPTAAPDGAPNVVFIMADDLGYGDVGAYGQTRIHTPRLDRMAREGVRFTQFYAGSTVCAPSRSALLTGQHTGHTYVRGNREHPEGQEPLPDRVREEPRSPGAGPAVVRGRYSHDAIVDEALAFSERNRRARFFLYLPVTIPHAELQAPDDADAPHVKDGRSVFAETPFAERHYGAQARPRATYAAMISRLDRDVGRILDTLAALGLDRNPVVFFTSDNGPSVEGGSDPASFRCHGGFLGGERDLYEVGIRGPMIVWGPGRIPAGRTSDQVWALWDVLPALAELAGTAPPSGIDGISMVPALTGRGTQRSHDHLYWEFHERGSAQAARMGRWKGVRRPMLTGPLEVYDLVADPAETRDVSARHPDVTARLTGLLDRARTPSALWRTPSERPTGTNRRSTG